jgi:RNA polymerase sigma factor (sigma-70 family)
MTQRDDKFLSAFLKTQSEIKRYLTRMTGSQEDAEDLAHEAWIKLARNSANASAAPVPYLKRIAKSLAIDHGRGRKHRATTEQIEDALSIRDHRPGPDQQVIDRDQVRELMRVIGELPERQKKMLVAARLEFRPYAEIAEEFNVSTRTVEMEINRALNYCSEKLGREPRK